MPFSLWCVPARTQGAVVVTAVGVLVALSVPEIRRLLGVLLTPVRDPARSLAWSIWRRRHQARARRAHYQRRHRQARDAGHRLSMPRS